MDDEHATTDLEEHHLLPARNRVAGEDLDHSGGAATGRELSAEATDRAACEDDRQNRAAEGRSRREDLAAESARLGAGCERTRAGRAARKRVGEGTRRRAITRIRRGHGCGKRALGGGADRRKG